MKPQQGSIEIAWREASAIRILEGTSEIMRHIVARDILRNSPAQTFPFQQTKDGSHDQAN